MIIFDVFIIFFMYLDTKIYKKLVTPLTALLSPIITSLCLLNILEPKMSNKKMEIYLLITALIWITLGSIIRIIFFRGKKAKKINKKITENFTKKSIKRLGILVIFIILVSIFISAKKYGIGNLKGKVDGILAHIFILSSVFLSIELINKKDLIFKILYLMYVILLLLIGGKYQLFLFVLASFLVKMENEKKISLKILKKIILIILLVFVIFSGVYYINFYLQGLNINFSNFFNFIINHIKYYFLSPMYIGHEMLKFSGQGNLKIAFTPFINIYEFILGSKNYINPILPFWTSYGITSNVGGLIPELVYSIGNIGMYLYMTFLGIISYVLENLTSKNKIWVYSNLILKSSLILCFFNNVFTVLGYVERVLGTIIITIVIIMFKKIKFIKN